MQPDSVATGYPTFSRRSLLSFLASSPLILASCRTSGSSESTANPDAQIDRVLGGYRALVRSDPSLPGVQSLAQLSEGLAGGLSPADLSLLTTAFYLKAREQVSRIPRTITTADVRSVLSRPIDMAPYGRSFLERTLAEARARAAADPAYAADLRRYRRRCHCLTSHTPCWICIAMALILILAIIAVLLVL